MSDRLSFEPTLALNYGKIDDLSTLGFGLNFGVLYHLTTERDRPQLFLRPLVGYAGSRFSGTPNGIADSNNGAALVGIGIGAKVPQGDRFALRFGADYERRLEDDPAPALNRYIATVGISFFTR